MTTDFIEQIQSHYGLPLPQTYLQFLAQAGEQAYDLVEDGEVEEWELRFMALDDQYLANTADLVDPVNPDPARLVPFAWSVSSGSNYLFDYRGSADEPAVVVIEHEMAMVWEDAQDEASSPEEAQQLMDDNVREIAPDFASFVARLQSNEG